MWDLSLPWWEYILRSVIIYAVVYILIRLMGKKPIGELSPFDLVLLLIISESVSSAITGGDDSLAAGLICVTTFVALNYSLDILSFKFRAFEKLLEGDPQPLILDGVINHRVRRREFITMQEIESAMRAEGVEEIKDVKRGTLETNGKISIVEKEKPVEIAP